MSAMARRRRQRQPSQWSSATCEAPHAAERMPGSIWSDAGLLHPDKSNEAALTRRKPTKETGQVRILIRAATDLFDCRGADDGQGRARRG